MQSEFARRLEKAEHESRWKLDQQVDSLSDASKTHLRQVSPTAFLSCSCIYQDGPAHVALLLNTAVTLLQKIKQHRQLITVPTGDATMQSYVHIHFMVQGGHCKLGCVSCHILI